MKKRIIGILFLVLASIIISMPYVKANEVSNNTVIGKITDDSKTVEQNKSVFVEMDIDNIENVKSITGYIASTTDSEQYITVELQNSTQGTWYYFIVPSTTVIGQTYIMPMIQVVYEDGTTITGKATGEFKVLQQEIEDNSKVIGKITDESKTVEQNQGVWVEMYIDNIENVKSITGYIASTTDPEQYITVELQNSTQGTWYYFIMPLTTVVGETYTMPMIQVVYEDGTTITGKVTGQVKIVGNSEESGSLNKSDNTTSKKILPNTGKNMIIGLVGVLVIFLIIIIIRSEKHKNIE